MTVSGGHVHKKSWNATLSNRVFFLLVHHLAFLMEPGWDTLGLSVDFSMGIGHFCRVHATHRRADDGIGWNSCWKKEEWNELSAYPSALDVSILASSAQPAGIFLLDHVELDEISRALRRLQSAARWSAIGICSILRSMVRMWDRGPPGNLLSSDLIAHNPFGALGAASLSMFFSIPGWACLFAGQQKLLKEVQSSTSE